MKDHVLGYALVHFGLYLGVVIPRFPHRSSKKEAGASLVNKKVVSKEVVTSPHRSTAYKGCLLSSPTQEVVTFTSQHKSDDYRGCHSPSRTQVPKMEAVISLT